MGTSTARRVGPWTLVERLGPSTWSAVDDLGVPAAVRLGDDADPERRALEALGHLDEPGLVRLAGSFHDGTTAATATSFVDGPTLATRRLDWRSAAAALRPVAAALAAVHAAGWVHGDVAATNIVLGESGGVLVDLASARPADRSGATGTPGSVAPEVAAGVPVTPAAEVFALAAVAAEVVGTVPDVLRPALDHDPSARPSMAELAEALRAASTAPAVDPRSRVTQDYGPRPPVPTQPAVPARRRTPALAGAVGVVAVAVALWPRGAPGVSTGPATCPTVEAPLTGDPDGDGCDVGAQWSDGVLTIALDAGGPASRVAVGAPGDVVLLGDWDCDGVDTPAAYRPSTGAVTTWDGWPTAGAAVVPADVRRAEPHGAAGIGTAGGCDHVVVRVAR